MRVMLIGLACTWLAAGAAADEPRVPTGGPPPVIAYAAAKAEKKKAVITLKVLEFRHEARQVKRTALKKVVKDVGGKTVEELVPVEELVTVVVQVPTGYRNAVLSTDDVKARDTAGKSIPPRKLADLLAAERPVLLSTSPEPVDPYHLLTTREDTVILHVDPAKLSSAPKK